MTEQTLPPPSGSAPSVASLASELRLAVMRLRRRLAVERQPDNELSLVAMSVLVALSHDRDLTLGELAARERVQPPSMTRTVNHLEQGGYVLRRPGESDRRQVIVSITARGRARVLGDRARRDAWLAQQLSDLSPEDLETLRRAAPILERLATS